jgi:abortive infection bacteriophage resistance protein
MKYPKPALTYTEQLELLISRKLTCDDRDPRLNGSSESGTTG